MELIQVLGILFALFAISRVMMQIRRNAMSVESGLFWVFIWISVMLVVVFPDFLGYLANLVGVGRGVDVLIYLGIVALFYLIYRSYTKIENLEREITKIVREIAIIERYEKKDVKKNNKGDGIE
ncbi:MAG: hypothetical protein PWP15_756 [Methanothermococcus sp.]|jgi:hypothetical protein|uniref:DUF2304 domain-containing protein n=1 Tax=Methanothermococcus TaxID=155862 RepID=UPI000362A363|nr:MULTISPECIES: DUF2304 family protein [Methanothermococcus]MDK2790249.1 hypothetical protein [Methanothermococcus sp.]MDK2987644.1 hypothetical protein [Methanothermococcus sp.]